LEESWADEMEGRMGVHGHQRSLPHLSPLLTLHGGRTRAREDAEQSNHLFGRLGDWFFNRCRFWMLKMFSLRQRDGDSGVLAPHRRRRRPRSMDRRWQGDGRIRTTPDPLGYNVGDRGSEEIIGSLRRRPAWVASGDSNGGVKKMVGSLRCRALLIPDGVAGALDDGAA
jgi:hypothetical protein